MSAEHHHHHLQRAGARRAPVLDIGGEVGALVVYLADPTSTGELEACPVGEPAARFHTGVHRRVIGYGPRHGSRVHGRSGRGGDDDAWAWTAVFPEVIEGSYHLLDNDGAPLAHVTVTGGSVYQLDLR
jgi:hypothetical protein